MADASDVVSTLVTLIANAIFPNGTEQPSVGGIDVEVFGGWPQQQQLRRDLAAGTCNISVFPLVSERNTTRYLQQWQQTTTNTPTLTLTASGQTVTITGTIPPVSNPHNVVVFANAIPYVYQVKPTDQLQDIASSLSHLIGQAVNGTYTFGNYITLPPGARLGACRVGVTDTSVNEIERTERRFQISIWANTPQARTSLSKVIHPTLSQLTFLTLPDGTAGRIRYETSQEDDGGQKEGLYRRSLIYSVEYPTIVARADTQVTQIDLNIDLENAGVPPPRLIETIWL